jgi:ribosomal protein S18 acetylase RimI-like enzyme
MVRLYVEKENHAAQTTYLRLGFEEMHFHLYQRKV